MHVVPRVERALLGQGADGASRHELPRPRGLGGPPGEGGGPGQGGRRHQEPALGRPGPVRAHQCLGHRVDLRRRDRGGGQRRGAARRAHVAQGAERCRGGGPRPPAHPGGEEARAPHRPHRDRGPDRDDPGPDQCGGDLCGLTQARDHHLRPRRFRGVHGDAGADRWRLHPRVPRRPLQLRVLQDPHGRPGQRPPGHRRAVPQDSRSSTRSGSSRSGPACSATTASGP